MAPFRGPPFEGYKHCGLIVNQKPSSVLSKPTKPDDDFEKARVLRASHLLRSRRTREIQEGGGEDQSQNENCKEPSRDGKLARS